MNLYFILLWLSSIFSTSLASVAAGGYEALFFYYAYRIDHEVNDGDKAKMSIAPDFGRHPDLATFNEFTFYCMEASRKQGYRQKVEGATTNPDVRTIGPVLIVEWNTGNYDLRKMLRAYAGLGNNVSPAHAKVLETFGDIVQTCRETNAKRAQPKNLDIILERARLSSRLIHQNRVYDQAYAKVELAQDTFFKFLSVQTKSVITDDGLQYHEIDTQRTLEASKEQGSIAEKLAEFETWSKGYVTSNQKARDHEVVIDAAKQVVDRLEARSPSC